jgi:hypothetical protein
MTGHGPRPCPVQTGRGPTHLHAPPCCITHRTSPPCAARTPTVAPCAAAGPLQQLTRARETSWIPPRLSNLWGVCSAAPAAAAAARPEARATAQGRVSAGLSPQAGGRRFSTRCHFCIGVLLVRICSTMQFCQAAQIDSCCTRSAPRNRRKSWSAATPTGSRSCARPCPPPYRSPS